MASNDDEALIPAPPQSADAATTTSIAEEDRSVGSPSPMKKEKDDQGDSTGIQSSPSKDPSSNETPGEKLQPHVNDNSDNGADAKEEQGVEASSSQAESVNGHGSQAGVSKDTVRATKSNEAQENVEDEHLDEEGRPLSAYEIQRLERIKRNRQKLAQLGLAKAKEQLLEPEDSGIKKNKPARSRKSEPMLPQRARSSRAKKKSLNYAEPPASVRSLLKGGEGASSKPSTTDDNPNDEIAESSERKRKWNRETERLPQDIYREFKRIKSHKRDILKEAQRAVKNAEKEIKYWTKRVEKYEKTFLRKKDETDEKRALGGKTSRELIQIIDERAEEIQHAVQEYEEFLYADQREHQRGINRKEAEEKMKILDALVRFPKALKSSTALLNTALLEGAPKDPPPQRRSRRGTVPETKEDRKPSSKRKGTKSNVTPEESKTITGQDDCSSLLSEVNPADDDQDGLYDEKETKQRKRVGRNVGGWISPDFSRIVDRRWLENDVPNSTCDMRTYVPQVGELVLYFVTGHKQYLEAHPDIVGKKTRSKMRIPLWERATRNRDEGGDGVVSPWWTNKWLDGLETEGYGDYPIVCRVERTYAEFPADPWSKIVKPGDDTNSSGQQIFFKKPRAGGKQTRKQRLRLAVDLRPLTQLIADGNREELPLPPLFSVATSPTNNTEPFIVPFCWAYYRSGSLRTAQSVVAANDDKNKCKIRIESIECPPHLGVLSEKDRAQFFANRKTWLESISSEDGILQAKVGQHFPLSVAKFLIHLWLEAESFNGVSNDADVPNTSVAGFSFFEVLQKTLPLWNSASILKDVYDRKRTKTCPWNLTLSKKHRESETPWEIGQFKFCLDDSLRSKLLCFVDGILADESASVDLFRDPVTEEVAPSYFCAVPIGFSLSKIVKRLTTEHSNGECYYRTSRQLLADVSAILDCALLYNSPESDVVSLASVLTAKIKDAVTVLIREHYLHAKEDEMLDHERRRVIHQRFSLQIGSAQSMVIKPFLSKPFRGDIQFRWTESNSQQKRSFQAGDSVEYSTTRHELFIAGHGPSLEARQSLVHFDAAASDEWVEAEVVWTRTDFPRSLAKQSEKQCETFGTLTTLQCLGLRFQGNPKVVTIYWRPCSFEEGPSLCVACKISAGESFLRLKPNNQETTDFEPTSQCMDFIKRRCSNALRPYEEDISLTKASIKLGHRPHTMQPGKKLPPSFSELFEDNSSPNSAPRRQKTKKQATKSQLEVSRLLELGWIPPWIMVNSKIDEDRFSRYKAHFPSPSMSLELVCLRLQSGFYRHRQAVENDIIEAYCGTVFMLLFDSWNQKKKLLSMKRIARNLSTNKNWDRLKATLDDQLNQEEVLWVKRFLVVRELFSVSLTVVSDLPHAIRMLGLVTAPTAEAAIASEVVDPDEQRAEAHQKLTKLLQAVGRDECNNNFALPSADGEPPLTKVKIMIGGKEVPNDNSACCVLIPAQAKMKNKEALVSVRLTLEGRPVSFSEFLDKSDETEGVKLRGGTAAGVYFHSEDYENNDYLARLVFKRPGRHGACARCRAYRRSMMVCRVMRRHANQDYDWAREMPGGEECLNKLILSLKDDSSIIVDAPAATISEAGGGDNDADDEIESVNPRQMLDHANAMLTAAEKIVVEAQTFAETPDRLSADFIEEAFPIDDGDGHFLYCVICGLAGDLLCCDGCSSVVHMGCIALEEPPPGDWFCEECAVAKRTETKGSSSTEEVSSSVSATALSYGPFERASFDESQLTAVTKKLHELRVKRPTQKVREARTENRPPQESDDESVDVDENEEINETFTPLDEGLFRAKKAVQKRKEPNANLTVSENDLTPSRRSRSQGQESHQADVRSQRKDRITPEDDLVRQKRTKRKLHIGTNEENAVSVGTRRSRRRKARGASE